MKQEIKEYLLHCKYERKLDEKTIKAYKLDLNHFVKYLLKVESIEHPSAIDKTILKAYIESINHYAANTLKRKIASLNAFFNYHEFEDNIEFNPLRKIRLRIKSEKRIPKTLNNGELTKILEYAYQQRCSKKKTSFQYECSLRNIAIIELMLSTGLRVSEVSNLQLKDFSNDFLLLRIIGKGNKERRIPITNDKVRLALKTYHAISNSKTAFFSNRFNHKLSTQSIRTIIQNHGIKSAFKEKVNPHTFRHSFATLLLERDTDIRYIQQFLGHSSITTTQIYTTVSELKKTEILTLKNPRNFIEI